MGLGFIPVAHELTGAMGPAARDELFEPALALLKEKKLGEQARAALRGGDEPAPWNARSVRTHALQQFGLVVARGLGAAAAGSRWAGVMSVGWGMVGGRCVARGVSGGAGDRAAGAGVGGGVRGVCGGASGGGAGGVAGAAAGGGGRARGVVRWGGAAGARAQGGGGGAPVGRATSLPLRCGGGVPGPCAARGPVGCGDGPGPVCVWSASMMMWAAVCWATGLSASTVRCGG